MPDTLSLYSFEDADGDEYGMFTTQDIREAREYAKANNLRIIENIYEWSEAIPVEGDDYTPTSDSDGYSYRYETDDGGPAEKCPVCGTDWAKQGGVILEYGDETNGDHEALTRLEDGELIDHDGEVAEGHHKGTLCGGCRAYLCDMDGIAEISSD